MTQKQKQKINKELECGNRVKIKSKSAKFYFYFQILNKFLCLSIIFILAYFIFSTNDLSIKGFVLRDLKMQFYKIDDTNKALSLQVVKLESNEYINQKAKEKKMVKVNKIDYIEIINGEVAIR